MQKSVKINKKNWLSESQYQFFAIFVKRQTLR